MAAPFDYEKFLDLSPDWVCIAGFDGYFKRINPAVSAVLGYPEEILYSRPIDSFVHEDDREVTSEARERLRKSEALINFDNRYVTSSGETIWLSWTSQPIPEQKVIFAIAKQITHQKRLEQETHKLLMDLSSVNDELKELNLIVSHDLRSPLGNLMGVFDLLDLTAVEDPDTLELIQILHKTAERLKDILDKYVDMLSGGISEERPIHPTPVELSLQQALASIRSLITSSGAKVSVDLSPKADLVHIHSTYLESIFLNLLTNAIKYTRPGIPPEIAIRCDRMGNEVQITIQDNGKGMELDTMNHRLFKLHQTFHDHPDSKGVGLYLVNRMVTQAGGEISVESEVGRGTTFRISLPG